MTVITDYMVIATGRSVPQVKALAENVEEELAKLDLFARRREGVNEGHWCILDYGDVMVHIFHEQDREYYQLERLWSNGTNEVEVALDGAGAAAEALQEGSSEVSVEIRARVIASLKGSAHRRNPCVTDLWRVALSTLHPSLAVLSGKPEEPRRSWHRFGRNPMVAPASKGLSLSRS